MNSTTAIIRQRGQLTIPKNIRKKYSWVRSNSAVTFESRADNEIVIKPTPEPNTKKPDWDDIWAKIKRVRSIKGKRGNLSQFVIEDRERH